MHSKTMKIISLPDNSLTTGKINIQRLNEAGYTTVKCGSTGLLGSSTVDMKVHSLVQQPFNLNAFYIPGTILGAGDPN